MYHKLDSLRGIAAILVILLHSPFSFASTSVPFIQNSYLFVDFFFILSGFVMTFAYAEKLRQKLTFTSYAILRLGRLYPLHLLTLIAWVPYVGVKLYLHRSGYGGSDPLLNSNFSTFISHLFLVQSLGFSDVLSWNYPSWSISAEIVAYGTFFIFIKLTANSLSLVVAILISISSYIIGFTCFPKFNITELGFVRGVSGFYLGVFLFYISKNISLSRFLTQLLEPLLILAIILSLSLAASNIGILTSLFLFSGAILIFSSKNSGITGSLLSSRHATTLGKYSYSLYMNHAIILAIASNIARHALGMDLESGLSWHSLWINLTLMVLICYLSKYTYRFIENPFRKFARDLVMKKSTPTQER